jgi:hypothetical protein
VAAIHEKGVLVGQAEAKNWVWEPAEEGLRPRWCETRAGQLYMTTGWIFRWRAGREVSWLAAEWFAGQSAQSAAFWEGYRRGAHRSDWAMRWVEWGRKFHLMGQMTGDSGPTDGIPA